MLYVFYMNLNHCYFIILPKTFITHFAAMNEQTLLSNVKDFVYKLYACAETSILVRLPEILQ